jgi:hypothetical protein
MNMTKRRTLSMMDMIPNINIRKSKGYGEQRKNNDQVNQDSRTWIDDFRAVLSRAKSLGPFQSLKSFFTASIHASSGRPLPLLVFSMAFRIPLLTGVSGGFR